MAFSKSPIGLIQKVLRKDVLKCFHLVNIVAIALNGILQTEIHLLIESQALTDNARPQITANTTLPINYFFLLPSLLSEPLNLISVRNLDSSADKLLKINQLHSRLGLVFLLKVGVDDEARHVTHVLDGLDHQVVYHK